MLKYEVDELARVDRHILLAFQSGKCDNVSALLLLVRDGAVMGFMSRGMVAGSVSEGENYLERE